MRCAHRALPVIEQAEQSLANAVAKINDPRDQAGFDALDNVETRLRLLNSLLKLTHGAAHASGPQLDF